ncbi:ABC transporter substrate-binding protein [Actinocatenispora rupis]|uniref:Peptide ABC transporter substrate-binding protein n=1 Tax=Actinocatenispora rupis TaxID=519421 RepID=A0A8J3J0K9_9ACTN|nr:ABC transporter substrate-binding protein [Actinocatenispora rupis]GID12008.1 peptide ABC transporter substrate-binding protein [Actinocatenispora rupis]
MTDESVPRTSRRRFLTGVALAGAGAGFGGTLLTGCTGTGATGGKRAQTLFVAGFQWAPPTSFNPLNPNGCWPTAEDNMQLLYESLFGFNLLDGKLEPHLATGIAAPDAHTLTVSMQPKAAWHDGKPVTADDVVFTFSLARTHPEVPFASFFQFAKSITATDAHTVTIALDPAHPNPAMVKSLLAANYVLPQHVWAPIAAKNKQISQVPNMTPVGSGPYKLDKHSAAQVSYTRHDGYWGKAVRGKLPAPKYVVHPIFKDNAAGDLAFERGEVDVMQQFTPQIWKMWQDKHEPIGTWYDTAPYQVPGSIPMLVCNTTRKGLSDPRVRRALAYAIDYGRIAKTAMSQYSDPAKSSLILPRGVEQQYFDAQNVAQHGWSYDPAKSRSILENELHARKGSDGVYRLPDGTRLGPWTAQTPTGWSDWQTALQVVAENAKAAGFDVATKFPQAAQTTTAVQNGDFDLACWYVAGVSPASPWQRFRDVLDDRAVPKLGVSAFYNYGRFSNPHVPALIDRAATLTGAAAKAVYGQLDQIFMANAPMIPLMYRPVDFYEFNHGTWTGFPTSRNPSGPPQFRGAGIDWLYDLKPATS